MSSLRRIERIAKRYGKVLTASPDETIPAAARRMTEADVGSLLVLDGVGKVVGILTERDLLKKVIAKAQDAATVFVRDVMTRTVISCTMNSTCEEANRLMAHHKIRHLPIIENGVPVGMISSRDVLAHQLSASQALVRRQARVLADLENEHPGITQIQKDRTGRVVI
jgi:CBS domain-containing protein